MIISKAINLVVVRPPKTGSTSLVFYFFNSGLLDLKTDIYSLDGYFSDWKDLEKYHELYGIDYSHITKFSTGEKSAIHPHATFNDLTNWGLTETDTPCVSTIRNPLARLSSAYNYQKKQGFLREVNPNEFWDAVKKKGVHAPQSSYFPSHAELFNTENLHEHAEKYITSRGGRVDKRIEMKKNPDNQLDAFLTALTASRKKDILDTYAKDFELWEKAYAVYN